MGITEKVLKIKMTAVIALAAALFLSVPALSQDRDSSVLDSFLQSIGEKSRAGGAIAARSAGTGHPRLDPTLAALGVVRNWDNLRQDTRDELADYIRVGPWRNGERSVYSVQSNGCSEVLSESQNQTLDSTHFRAIYTTSVPNQHRASTSYVQSLLSMAEYSWNYEVNILGLPEPVSKHQDGRIRIYVCDLLGSSGGTILGRTWTETVYPDYVAATYIEMDNDYVGVNIHSSITTEEFISVIFAHEFFHSIQFGINYYSPTYWLLESNAVWIEDEVYPNVNDYVYSYLGTRYRNLDISIDHFSFADTLGYGAAIFFKYITENISNPGFVKSVWSTMDTECDNLNNHSWCGQDDSEIPLIDTMLSGLGTDVETVYRDFNIANYTKDYADGGIESFPDVPAQAVDITGGTASEQGTLDHLAARFYSIEHPDGGASLKPTVMFSGAQSADWRVSVLKYTGADPGAVDISLSGGSGELTLGNFGATYDNAVIIVNNVHTSADDQSYTLSFDLDTYVQPPASEPPQRTVSSTTGVSGLTAHSMALKTGVDVVLKSITYTNNGTGLTGVTGTWRLYIDNNADGAVDAGDSLLASVSGVDLQAIPFSDLDVSIPSGETKNLLLGLDVPAGQLARINSAGVIPGASAGDTPLPAAMAIALSAILFAGLFTWGAEAVRIGRGAKLALAALPVAAAIIFLAGCGGGGGGVAAAPPENENYVRLQVSPGDITLEDSSGEQMPLSGSTVTGPKIVFDD